MPDDSLNNVLACVRTIAADATADGDFSGASFDQLAEEVMELHLAIRGCHEDTPAMEWLEIASIAVNALRRLAPPDVAMACAAWQLRHNKEVADA